MPYELAVETATAQHPIRFRLRDEHGRHLGENQLVFHEHRQALWEGLFDTRQYVQRYTGSMCREGQAEPATAAQLIDDLGVFLGQKVLGPEIFDRLARDHRRRTLLVRLPAAGVDPLAAAFARVPWEIARGGPAQPPLLERNLLVRAVTDDMPPGNGDAATHSAETEPYCAVCSQGERAPPFPVLIPPQVRCAGREPSSPWRIVALESPGIPGSVLCRLGRKALSRVAPRSRWLPARQAEPSQP